MTESEDSKLDQLLRTAQDAKRALNRRTVAFLAILVVQALLIIQLLDVAATNKENGNIAKENSEAIRDATGDEARARSAATLSGAINELERVGVCAALYATDEFHPACSDITAAMDEVRAGKNPFAR